MDTTKSDLAREHRSRSASQLINAFSVIVHEFRGAMSTISNEIFLLNESGIETGACQKKLRTMSELLKFLDHGSQSGTALDAESIVQVLQLHGVTDFAVSDECSLARQHIELFLQALQRMCCKGGKAPSASERVSKSEVALLHELKLRTCILRGVRAFDPHSEAARMTIGEYACFSDCYKSIERTLNAETATVDLMLLFQGIDLHMHISPTSCYFELGHV